MLFDPERSQVRFAFPVDSPRAGAAILTTQTGGYDDVIDLEPSFDLRDPLLCFSLAKVVGAPWGLGANLVHDRYSDRYIIFEFV